MFVRQNKKQKVRSSTSNSNEFRRSTPWKDSQLQPLSLERLDDSEDVATRPPNSPLTPERELAPQQTPQPTTEAAAPNPGASQGEVDADRRPTPAFGILSLQSRDQAAGKMMDHPAMQDSPPVTSDISSGPFLAKGHPLYSIGGRFVNVEHVLAGDETSAVSEAETPSILHEAHGRAEEHSSLHGSPNPGQAPLPQSRAHISLGRYELRHPGNVHDQSINPIPAYLLPESTPNASPARMHPITSRPLSQPVVHPPHNMFSPNMPPNHGVLGGPSNVQLLGYAGLEDFPYTGQMISSKMHNVYTEFFRYDNASCPAGIIYADPKRGRATGEAWLYVRNMGDVQWKRDYLAERSGMRHWIYMKDVDEDWQWEQILGNVLDARDTLNLWVKRRKSAVGTTGLFCIDNKGNPRPGVRLRPTGQQGEQ